MIFRITQKLSTKISVGALTPLPVAENPFTDWSAALFEVGRTPYVLLTNTPSPYSTVIPGRGITDGQLFHAAAVTGIRLYLAARGHAGVWDRLVGPGGQEVRFAKALNRSITGSMNDMIKFAAHDLSIGDRSLIEIADVLNDIPMSALEQGDSGYGFPSRVFDAMVSAAANASPSGGHGSQSESIQNSEAFVAHLVDVAETPRIRDSILFPSSRDTMAKAKPKAPSEAAEGPTMTKAEAVRTAVADGFEKPAQGVVHVKEKFGLDVTTQQFSLIKSQAKKKAGARKKKTTPHANGDTTALARQVKQLVKTYGAETIKGMADVFAE